MLLQPRISRAQDYHSVDHPDVGDTSYYHCLRLTVELGHTREIAESIELLAGLECERGRPECAARLFGAAEALLEDVGLVALAGDRFQYAENVAATRAALGTERLASAWRDGRQMPLDRVVEYTLSVDC